MVELNENEARLIIESLISSTFRGVVLCWGDEEIKQAILLIEKLKTIITHKSQSRMIIKNVDVIPVLQSLLQMSTKEE